MNIDKEVIDETKLVYNHFIQHTGQREAQVASNLTLAYSILKAQKPTITNEETNEQKERNGQGSTC